MGAVLFAADDATAGATTDVEWWVPPSAPEATTKPGRKKQVLDIFGPWQALGACTPDNLGDYALPAPSVRGEAVLLSVPELEPDGSIPYPVFDRLRTEHHIDVTGLTLTNTLAGSRYRHWALLRRE